MSNGSDDMGRGSNRDVARFDQAFERTGDISGFACYRSFNKRPFIYSHQYAIDRSDDRTAVCDDDASAANRTFHAPEYLKDSGAKYLANRFRSGAECGGRLEVGDGAGYDLIGRLTVTGAQKHSEQFSAKNLVERAPATGSRQIGIR